MYRHALSAPLLSMLLMVALVLLFFFFSRGGQHGSTRKPELSFNRNNTIRILQLTDLHLGEDPFTDWAPRADRKTFRLIRKVIRLEQPDLIVLSGDQLTGNNVDANATEYYNLLASLIEEFSIPYCLIFGNHDDMDFDQKYPDGTTRKHSARMLRADLMRVDRQHPHSLSQAGPADVNGVSNYVLPVYDAGKDIKLQIMLLDSGGGSMEQEIVEDQLEWYLSRRLDGVDAVAFQHIPTKEFRITTAGCQGFDGEHGLAPLRNDPANETDFLNKHDPRLHFVAVGHNHGNSYCCPTDSLLSLCFGRHSGYGGYGKWERGARLFDITLQKDSSVTWKTWVRLESESRTDFYTPETSAINGGALPISVAKRRQRLPPAN